MGRSVQDKEGKCQGFTVTVTPTVAYDYYTGQSCYCLSGLDRSSHRLVPSSVTLANAYMLEARCNRKPRWRNEVWLSSQCLSLTILYEKPQIPYGLCRHVKWQKESKIRRRESRNGIAVVSSVTYNCKNKYINVIPKSLWKHLLMHAFSESYKIP